MVKLFTVHYTVASTGERNADTVTANNPKHAEQIVRKAFEGETLHIRKIKFVKPCHVRSFVVY